MFGLSVSRSCALLVIDDAERRDPHVDSDFGFGFYARLVEAGAVLHSGSSRRLYLDFGDFACAVPPRGGQTLFLMVSGFGFYFKAMTIAVNSFST